MKFLIFDAGPIISLTMNGLLPVLENLRKNFDGEFILTRQVKREVVDRPLKIKKYALEAVQIQNLIERKIFRMSDDFVDARELEREIKRILNLSSGVLRVARTGEKINLIHEGEASCIAFSFLCREKNAIVIDERTTRLLTEAPRNLKEIMERKLHTKLKEDFSSIKKFTDLKFIRSSEVLFVAYKKNLIPLKRDKQLLDALLYGVKTKGTAISSAEIEEMKTLV